MPIFTVNDLPYHVEIQGNGAAILMLHGFTGCATNWEAIRAALQDRYQVIAVDLLGHGQTAAPDDSTRYRIEHAAADLVALIAQIGLDKVHLLGYSMGGRLALYMACYHPGLIRSLILESGSPGLSTEAERRKRQLDDEVLADRIEQDGLAQFVDYWEALPLFATQQHLPETIRRALHKQRLGNTPRGLANSLRGMGTGTQPSLWGMLAQIVIPTLLLSGALDEKFAAIAQQMHLLIPGSTLVTISGAGHAIHLESPSDIIDKVSNFLNSNC